MIFNNDTNNKALKIKAFLLDVDGVLTDGSIIYDDNGLEYKKFNVKDGQIISHLKKLNFNIHNRFYYLSCALWDMNNST